MSSQEPIRELIVYATPNGALASQCVNYFRRAERELGLTTAQLYPPHCTLTGFFHRRGSRADQAIAEVSAAITAIEVGSVEVVDVVVNDDWLGLELRSSWLHACGRHIARGHQIQAGEDPIRVKEWLHLSLAYGTADLVPYVALAGELVDPSAPVSWSVAVWERITCSQRPGHPEWIQLS